MDYLNAFTDYLVKNKTDDFDLFDSSVQTALKTTRSDFEKESIVFYIEPTEIKEEIEYTNDHKIYRYTGKYIYGFLKEGVFHQNPGDLNTQTDRQPNEEGNISFYVNKISNKVDQIHETFAGNSWPEKTLSSSDQKKNQIAKVGVYIFVGILAISYAYDTFKPGFDWLKQEWELRPYKQEIQDCVKRVESEADTVVLGVEFGCAAEVAAPFYKEDPDKAMKLCLKYSPANELSQIFEQAPLALTNTELAAEMTCRSAFERYSEDQKSPKIPTLPGDYEVYIDPESSTITPGQLLAIEINISEEAQQKIAAEDIINELYLIGTDGVIKGLITSNLSVYSAAHIWNSDELIHWGGLDTTTKPTKPGSYRVLMISRQQSPIFFEGDSPIDQLVDGFDRYENGEIIVERDGEVIEIIEPLYSHVSSGIIEVSAGGPESNIKLNESIENQSLPWTAEEQAEIDMINEYYMYLVSGELEKAYEMKAGDSNNPSFETFKSWYENVDFAQTRNMQKAYDHTYSFEVDLTDSEGYYANYHVIMEISNGKLKTISSVENKSTIESNELFQSVAERCYKLDGNPHVEHSMLSGEEEVFCSFEDGGECTQNELISGGCYKEN